MQTFLAQVQNHTPYIGRCYLSTQAIPYQPWIELLDSLVAHMADSALERLPHFGREQVARLLPSLAQRLGRTPTTPPSGRGEAELLFHAVMQLLIDRSTRRAETIFTAVGEIVEQGHLVAAAGTNLHTRNTINHTSGGKVRRQRSAPTPQA